MDDTSTRTTLELGTDKPIDRLVVPVTLERRYDRGVSAAVQLAGKWSLPVHLVRVGVEDDETVSIELGRAIEAARDALEAARPTVEVDDTILAGAHDPAGALAAWLKPSDLVVMTTAAGELADDSFAQSLAHDWGGPILMLGPDAELGDLSGDVAVALDGSSLAERVIPAARGLAAALGTRVKLVEIVSSAVTAHIEDLKARGERVSESAYLRDAAHRTGDPLVNWDIVHDDAPSEALADFVAHRDVAVLAMATHGKSGLPRRVFGSTCVDTVRRSRRAVLVLRPTVLPPEEALTA